MTTRNLSSANIARAAVEGLLSSMAYCADKIRAEGVTTERIVLVGGGARSEAVRRIAPAVFGATVHVPTPGEYVALGAARQAAWALSGNDATPEVLERYLTAQRLTLR